MCFLSFDSFLIRKFTIVTVMRKAFLRQSGVPMNRPANGQSVLLGHLEGHSGEQGGAVAASPGVTGPGSHCSSTSLGGYKTSLCSRTHRAKETLKLVLDF